MATQNEKGGSDLDIFEGLGKKGGQSRPPAPPAPPGPPSVRPTPPPPPGARPQDGMKRTLLGVAAPPGLQALPTPPPPSGAAAPSSTPSRTPPPPPGRGSLPPVVAPPPRTSASALPPPAASKPVPAPAPSAAATAPNPSPAVDMDWDDEDEATHIFDKADDQTIAGKPAPAPVPAAGAPPPPAAFAKVGKTTLLGLTAPQPHPPPPPSSNFPAARPTPPPPPPTSQAFARASSMPSSAPGPATFPPPPTINPVPPPPATAQGLGPLMTPSAPPPPPPVAIAQPMPMPMPLPAPAPLPRAMPAPAPEYHPPPRNMEATALVRPPPSRTGLYVVLGLVGLAVIGIAVFLLMPRSGRIAVNVTDGKGGSINRVDIFVDGRKTPCETAPCIVDQVSAGSHEVKVLAEGYAGAAAQAVSVESGKDATASFTLSAASKGSGLKVAGSQAGVKLYVDDQERGPLPQEIKDLTPGDHTIKIAGSERYQPLEKHVSVEKDSIQDLGTVTLKVLKGKATISLGTPGARVYLVSGSDRRELPMLPISVDIDTTKTWSLQASKTGYSDYNQAIGFDDGQAEKNYVVALDPKGSTAPVVANNVPAPPPPAPVPQPVSQPAPPAPPPAAPEGDSQGYLNINSIPASTCYLDGRSLGSTPKGHTPVKPGTHTVKFVTPDGQSQTITVKVGAGETKPAVARISSGE